MAVTDAAPLQLREADVDAIEKRHHIAEKQRRIHSLCRSEAKP
jgi:hypothetical protein